MFVFRLMRMIFDVKIVLRFRLFAVPASTVSASTFSSRTCSDIDGVGSDGFGFSTFFGTCNFVTFFALSEVGRNSLLRT